MSKSKLKKKYLNKIQLTTRIKLPNQYIDLVNNLSQVGENLYNQVNYLKRQNYSNHNNSTKSNKSIKFSKPYLNFKNPEIYQ